MSPVTARTAPSRNVTPYLRQQVVSEDGVDSVGDDASRENTHLPLGMRPGLTSQDSSSLESLESDSGSVLRHSYSPDNL